jgi:hypothetical protein
MFSSTNLLFLNIWQHLDNLKHFNFGLDSNAFLPTIYGLQIAIKIVPSKTLRNLYQWP